METVTRSLCGVSGLLLFALGVLIYPDEQKRLQSRLEDWWVRLDYARSKVFLTEHRFLMKALLAANALLDAVFGRKLISTRLLLVSPAISILLPLCVFAVTGYLPQRGTSLVLLVIGLALLVLSRWGWVGFTVALTPALVIWIALYSGSPNQRLGVIAFTFGLVSGVWTDMIMLACVRTFIYHAPRRFLALKFAIGAVTLPFVVFFPFRIIEVLRPTTPKDPFMMSFWFRCELREPSADTVDRCQSCRAIHSKDVTTLAR